ncbi:MAG: hypothetical protein CVU56_17870 [Deltaproteobacteria bacterium HGW-Deltaproteobacteria-14]|nr:MAG: hypothetical protein CVU56_17870 [Deltaproteobacteria bacterium HGW-Deltaproteobacteria-14]
MAAAGCAEPVAGPAATAVDGPPSFDTTLGLQLVERTASRAVVDLWYAPTEGQAGPRAMELWLRLPGGVTLASADAGEAATAAGKTLVAQAHENHELRLVIYGTASLDRVAAGRLASLRLDVTAPGPAGSLQLELLDRLPIFAPAEANSGLRLPPPLALGGN